MEYVADDEAIARYGLNVLEVSAFGCTSRGQAHRTGKWILETERLERQSVSFSVGRDGLKHLPGDIIQIADSGYAGIRIGGRIKKVIGQNVQLDRDVELPEIDHGATAYLTWIGADAKPIRTQIFSHPSTDTVVLGEVPNGMCAGDIWTLSRDDIRPRLFRCIKITEEKTDTATQFKIEAVQHEPNKEAVVDAGAVFDPKPDTIFGGKIPPVEHLKIDAFPYGDSYQIKMRWDTPRVVEGISFEVRLSRADKLHLRDTTTDPEYVCYDLPLGDYTVSIRGKNAGGQLGQETESTFTIAPPTAPTSLLLRSTNFSVTARPVVQPPTALGTQYEWFKGMSRAEVEAMSEPLGRAMIVNDQECVPDTEYWYGCRAVNGVGKSTLVIASIKTKLQPEDILNLIGPEIPKLDWAKDLSQMVEKNSSNIVLLSDRAALVVNKEGRVSGITVTAESEASAVDFLADFVSFTDPDTLQRNLYWDNRRRTLVVKGELRLLDGTAISSKNDLGNGAGGVFRLRTETGVFPSDAQTANSLFTSAFNTLPGKDTVFTVYALDGNGHITRTESRMYDGREWVVPKLFMDGDLIALGTIKGDRLVAGTEIYSPVIKSGLVEAATIRSNAFPPAFELLPDGTLNARKANVSGNISATSGRLQNVIIDDTCEVKRIKAQAIEGDIFTRLKRVNNRAIHQLSGWVTLTTFSVPSCGFPRWLDMSTARVSYYTSVHGAGVVEVRVLIDGTVVASGKNDNGSGGAASGQLSFKDQVIDGGSHIIQIQSICIVAQGRVLKCNYIGNEQLEMYKHQNSTIGIS
ncbi:MAG: phage tail tip protein J-related protein [Plesiomonas shigelloides]